MSPINRFQLTRLCIPVGRTIGDNNCAYDAFDVCSLRLEDSDGEVSWGFGEKAHGGVFRKMVSWKAEMPGEKELLEAWQPLWKQVQGKEPSTLLEVLPKPWERSGVENILLSALRMGLWDMRGRQSAVPLREILGGRPECDSVMAYASPCGFPQPTEWVVHFFQQKVAHGFQAVKVKVGHPEIEWDVRRLTTVREALGSGIEIAVDGNTAWDGPGTLCWMERMEKEGLNISYVEDPVSPDNLEAYRLLAREAPLRIVGHDYVPDPDGLRPLLDTGALGAIRIRDGIDYAIAAARLAGEYDLNLIQCNTFGEHSIHFSVSHPRVERMEFADLGWNDLFEKPVRARAGRLFAPTGPGLGLVPKPDLLNAWHSPKPS